MAEHNFDLIVFDWDGTLFDSTALITRCIQDSCVDLGLPRLSGLDLLLVPDDVREVEAVTAPAIRRVLAMLRQAYDLVVIDVGSRVTPVQAAVVEMADEVIEAEYVPSP